MSGEREPLSLLDAWDVIWQQKWLVLATVLIVVGAATVYALTATEWYRAEVLLKATDNRSTANLSGQIGGLGGLASLAGIGLSSNTSAEPLAVLTSREFTAAFINEHSLLPVLFAKKWDSIGKQWKSAKPSDRPDVRDGVKFFDKVVRNVQEDKKTGFVRMSIEWTDPQVAADWTNLLIAQLNQTMRTRALSEGEANVAFLKQEIAATNVVALQQSIGRVLENELQKLMLANANQEYAFKILDHAEAPKWRSRPERTLIVVTAFLVALAISVFFVLARHAVRQSSRQS
jgi:uncharacterized protein involved in exopolysaccharide biosynthesis